MSDTRGQFQELASLIADRLANNLRVRRNLPGGGRVRIDRQLPFLCVYRQPPDHEDPGTRELVTSEASYLHASGEPVYREGIHDLCCEIIQTLQEHFGAFLLFEIWAAAPASSSPDSPKPDSPKPDSPKPDSPKPGSPSPDPADRDPDPRPSAPSIQIVTSESNSLPTAVDTLRKSLEAIQVGPRPISVQVVPADEVGPPNMPPLIDPDEESHQSCFCLGLEIQPIYRSEQGDLYPMVLQALRRQLGPALRKTVQAFTGSRSHGGLAHYQSYGPSTLVKAARLVDQQLCEVSESFDMVLQVTPVNFDSAWRKFSNRGFQRPPAMYYRPLPYHPNLLKRQLFSIPIERVEDATLAYLYWEKQNELDRQITALGDIDSPNFLYTSLQLYGQPDRELIDLAKTILTTPVDDPGAENSNRSRARRLTPRQLVSRARREIDYYHQRLSSFTATVELCDNIASGILVANGRLYISNRLRLSEDRVESLLHHEVGTHLLTYFNGRAQPFQQLYAGLAGYEPLQEGLAVLAEYLSGGLTRKRLRQLAARVVAVAARIDGATFLETFRQLHDTCGLSARGAFSTTFRVYRSGGFTKDAVYLEGLRDLLKYLAAGHDVEPLYVGKIALSHVPSVQELRRRDIIQPPALMPRFWKKRRDRHQILDHCRGLTVLDLLHDRDPCSQEALSSR